METKLAVFQSKEIRRTLHHGEWWFSVSDVVEALTATSNATDYIKKMRKWISPGIVDSPKSCYNAAGGCHDTEEEKVVYARVQD